MSTSDNTGNESQVKSLKPCPWCGEIPTEDGISRAEEKYGGSAKIRSHHHGGWDFKAWNNAWAHKKIAELEEYNARLTGERFSERNHKALHSRIAELEKELEEEARLSGKGASREAALIANVAMLEKMNAEFIEHKLKTDGELKAIIKLLEKRNKELEAALVAVTKEKDFIQMRLDYAIKEAWDVKERP